MARNLNKAFVVAIVAIAALLHSSTAQTTHVVGDSLGWLVPPSPDAYTTWAANQTFKAGDILVFNFATGSHDVAEVPKAAFDACNTSSPISRVTNGPASITLSSGEHYYICTVTGHCGAGQKLAINVSTAASSPAPQPSSPSPPPTTPSPVSAPTPASTPSSAPTPTSTPTSAPTPASTPSSAPTPTSTPTSAPTPTSTPTPASTPTSATPPSSMATPPSSNTPASPAPTGVASPPPPGNSAKSLQAVSLSATLLAIIVVGLLY